MDDYDRIVNSEAIYLDASCLVKIAKEEGDSSRTMRSLLYSGTIPAYTSLVGLGEFIGAMGRRNVQAEMGIGRYLFHCRGLLGDLEMGKIQRAEPPEDRLIFFTDAERIYSKNPKMGGGDLWHLLSVVELKRRGVKVCLVTYDQGMEKVANSEHVHTVYGKRLDPGELVDRLRSAGKYVAPPPPPSSPTGT